MSNQSEQDHQQPETITVEEVRAYLLAELEASQQALAEVSDEELTQIVGAGLCCSRPKVQESVHALEKPAFMRDASALEQEVHQASANAWHAGNLAKSDFLKTFATNVGVVSAGHSAIRLSTKYPLE